MLRREYRIPGTGLNEINDEESWMRGQQTCPLNPLSPIIHIQILQTDLYTFPLRISQENLIKDQSIFS